MALLWASKSPEFDFNADPDFQNIADPDPQSWETVYLFKWWVSGGGGGSTPTTGQTVTAAAVVQGPFGLPLFDWCKFRRRHLGKVVSVVPPPSRTTTAAAPAAIRRAVAVEIVVESFCCLFHLKKWENFFKNKEEKKWLFCNRQEVNNK